MRHWFYTFFIALAMLNPESPAKAQETPQRIVMLGDSLTAGYGLESGQSLTSELEKILTDKGHNIRIDNAGVSGDTTAGGLSRLEWATGGWPQPSLVIVALGANDMLRGLSNQDTYDNLDKIITSLKASKTPVLLVGMQAPTNMGAIFMNKFTANYADLAKKHKIPFYPFMLEGVALKPELNLTDGIHPNLEGTRIIATNMAPAVIKALPAK